MRLETGRWLTLLRHRRRAVLCAVLPALTLSAVSGPACAAMRTAPVMASETHTSHVAHTTHHENLPQAHEPAAPCPHCPLESGAANADHTSCVTIGVQEDGGAAPTKASTASVPPVFLASWLLPAARASPPLIDPSLAHNLPPADSVTLTIRHCVLLI